MQAARSFIWNRSGAALAALALLCVWIMPALALDFPALSGRVVDQASIIPAAQRDALTQKLVSLEDKSGIQLVVATVSSLQGTDIESFANALFRNWKLGDAKKNNGILLLVAPNDRKVRIEVGYGVEGVMTDALSSVIIRGAIIPRFRSGDFAGGVDRGTDAIIDALSNDQSEWQAKAKVRPDSQDDLLDQLMPFIIFALFVFIVISMIRNARGNSGRWVRRGGNTIFIPGPSTGGWSSGSGGGGWSSGGSDSGGGGFSGGGGSSGGGGASGDW